MMNHAVAQSVRMLASSVIAQATQANKSHPVEAQELIRFLKKIESDFGAFLGDEINLRYLSLELSETATALESLLLSEAFFDSHVKKLSLSQLREFNDKLVAFRSRIRSFNKAENPYWNLQAA